MRIRIHAEARAISLESETVAEDFQLEWLKTGLASGLAWSVWDDMHGGRGVTLKIASLTEKEKWPAPP